MSLVVLKQQVEKDGEVPGVVLAGKAVPKRPSCEMETDFVEYAEAVIVEVMGRSTRSMTMILETTILETSLPS